MIKFISYPIMNNTKIVRKRLNSIKYSQLIAIIKQSQRLADCENSLDNPYKANIFLTDSIIIHKFIQNSTIVIRSFIAMIKCIININSFIIK